MKKFSLLLIAALMTLCGYAQTKGEHGETISEFGVIIGMPEGANVKTYEFQSLHGVYNEETVAIDQVEENRGIEVVEFEDGTMFFKNPVTGASFNSYVKGRREGNKVLIPSGQPLAHSTSKGINVVMKHVIFELNGDITNVPGDIEYNVTKNGNSEVLAFSFSLTEGYHFISALYDEEDGIFASIGDREIKMSYFEGEGDTEEALKMPEGATLKTYSCRAYSYGSSAETGEDFYANFYVYVAEVGDEVYMSGIYYLNPEYVVKGKKEGDRVVFPQHQFLGKDGRGVNIFAVACVIGVDDDGDEVIVDRDHWYLDHDSAKDEYDGGDCVLRFARDRFYAYGNSYEQIDEIHMTLVDASSIDSVTANAIANGMYDFQGRKIKNAKGLVITNEGGKMVKRFVK